MEPIIKGTEVVIPLRIEDENAKEQTKEPVEFKIDFWESIAKLSWVDRDDDFYPHANPKTHRGKWSYDEFREVQREIRYYYDTLKDHMDNQNFWDVNHIDVADRPKLILHIIGRGKQTYDGVMADTTFAIAFIGQDCGFIDYVKRYK